jgi:hypothetical protein
VWSRAPLAIPADGWVSYQPVRGDKMSADFRPKFASPTTTATSTSRFAVSTTSPNADGRTQHGVVREQFDADFVWYSAAKT